MPKCCCLLTKILNHKRDLKKELNFHNAHHKNERPTVWCVEEQTMRVPGAKVSAANNTSNDASIVPSSVITSWSENNASRANMERRSAAITKVDLVSDEKGRKTTAGELAGQCELTSLARHGDHRTIELPHNNTSVQVHQCSGSQPKRQLPQSKTNTPATTTEASEFYLPLFLLPSWNKLQRIHFLEANAQVLHFYYLTLVERNARKSWSGTRSQTEVEKQTRLFLHDKKRVLAHLDSLDRDHCTIQREIEDLMVQLDREADPAHQPEKGQILVTECSTTLVNEVQTPNAKPFKIPAHLHNIWKQLVNTQIQIYNLDIRFHQNKLALKHNLQSEWLRSPSEETGRQDADVFRSNMRQIKERQALLDATRWSNLRQMKNMLCSETVKKHDQRFASSAFRQV